MTLTYFIIIPILIGTLIYIFPKTNYFFIALIVEVPLFILSMISFVKIQKFGNIHNILGAPNSILGIELIATRFNIVFIILTIFLFFCGFLYSLKDDYMNKKFTLLFFILQGLISGVFLTDDLFNIYVLLEVATVIVTILIIFKRDSYAVYDGMIYLFSQIVCMAFYLFGIGYLYKIFGVLSISTIRQFIPYVSPQELILPFAFIMTAIGVKSALFPLFSWLPRAHGTPSAPSSVSAILSGLYVKSGVYLFIVFTSLFYPVINLSSFFLWLGVITSVLGFSLAIAQTDIKLILAFHTVSQIGLIIFGFCIPNPISNYGAIYHIFNHAIFKSLLFFSAGIIIKKYGTRNIKEIHGVIKKSPILGIATLVGALGITGAPFFNGSISKYFIQYGIKGNYLEYFMYLINMGTLISFVKYTQMLWGNEKYDNSSYLPKKIVLITLSLICFLGGIFGENFVNLWFGTSLNINPRAYIEKSFIYFIMLAFAWIIYKYIIYKNTLIPKLKGRSLNFLQIIFSIVIFFMTLSVLGTLKYII